MTTNYYAQPTAVPEAGGLHIGQSSAGMDFLWRGHTNLRLTTREAWEKYLDRPEITIVDEYGEKWSIDEFMLKVVNRTNIEIRHAHLWLRYDRTSLDNSMLHNKWVDPQGHPFCGMSFS